MPNRSSSASFRARASLISLPTTVPILRASAIVSEWKLPAPVFRTAVTFPEGVTPITTQADAHASSSGAGSTSAVVADTGQGHQDRRVGQLQPLPVVGIVRELHLRLPAVHGSHLMIVERFKRVQSSLKFIHEHMCTFTLGILVLCIAAFTPIETASKRFPPHSRIKMSM